MAHLHKKIKKDHTYYYIRESQRIKGRPTIVNQVYLGTADKVQSLLDFPEGSLPEGFSPKEYGSVFLINELDQDIDLAAMIDELLPPGKKIRGPSLGEIIFYAAMNRAIAPTSKRKLAAWYEQTDIQRIRPVRLVSLSSQNFWNHWDRIRTPELEKIKNRFFKKIVSLTDPGDNSHLLLEASLLFPATGNATSVRGGAGPSRTAKLPRRGVRVALLTNEKGIPVYYQAYEDDEPVSRYFDQILTTLLGKVAILDSTCQDLTVLLGIGMNSSALREKIVGHQQVHYLAAVPPDASPALLALPLSRYQVLPCRHNQRLQARGEAHYSIRYAGHQQTAAGQEVILFDPALFKKARRELRDKVQKLRQDLIVWQRELRQRPADQFAAEIQNRFGNRCRDLGLTPEVMDLTYTQEYGKNFVQSRLNRPYCTGLLKRMGKIVLETDRLDWSPEVFADLAVERGLLGDSPNRPPTIFQSALTPQYHWTDSKIPIHVFVCMVALTYLCFLNSRLAAAGLLLNAKEAMEEMRSLKTAIFLLSEDTKPLRLFEEPSDLQLQIIDALGYEMEEGRLVPQQKEGEPQETTSK
ncbi:MAG: IS1634 family transposase [Desulfobacca sp.]|uniref:IS1634 family transposase n=1 Tax=Desulfobacca sp. TaxID=2067990 RepID=UPI00404A3078